MNATRSRSFWDLKNNHILQALLLVVGGWLVVTLSSVIVAFFIAVLFIILLHPAVSQLKRWHLPTGLAVLVPILAFLGLLVLIGLFILPSFIHQIDQFINQAPHYISRLQKDTFLKHHHITLTNGSITRYLQQHSHTITATVTTILGTTLRFVTGVITIIVVTIYGVASYDRSYDTLLSYIPKKHRRRAADVWRRIERKIITWVGAQLLLSVVVGLMVWLGSWLIGLPFPGVLGLLSGVLELVPTLGPIAATVPGFLLGLTISVQTAIFAVVLHIIVSQIESHLLAPWLLGKTVRLHPIVIIFSLLAGTVLYGLLGTLLAVPSALVFSAVVDSYRGEVMPGSKAERPSKLAG